MTQPRPQPRAWAHDRLASHAQPPSRRYLLTLYELLFEGISRICVLFDLLRKFLNSMYMYGMPGIGPTCRRRRHASLCWIILFASYNLRHVFHPPSPPPSQSEYWVGVFPSKFCTVQYIFVYLESAVQSLLYPESTLSVFPISKCNPSPHVFLEPWYPLKGTVSPVWGSLEEVWVDRSTFGEVQLLIFYSFSCSVRSLVQIKVLPAGLQMNADNTINSGDACKHFIKHNHYLSETFQNANTTLL